MMGNSYGKNLSLLKKVLNLNDSDVRAIVDSKLTVYDLIFSESSYLRESLKLDESLILKFAAIRKLIRAIQEKGVISKIFQ